MAALMSGATQLLGRSVVLSRWAWMLVAVGLLAVLASGCYNNNTGEANVGGAISFKLPAFPETGSNVVEIFTEMHYQPSFRPQEGPRLLPPPDSVPVTGKELVYISLDEYRPLVVPDRLARSYDQEEAQALFSTNCAVCHGLGLKGDGVILRFWPKVPGTEVLRGPVPADLTDELTRNATDGELFGFLSGGGRQGLAARERGRPSNSAMPEFRRLLTEKERWTLVQFLRSQIGP